MRTRRSTEATPITRIIPIWEPFPWRREDPSSWQKNKFSVGEELEVMRPDGSNLPVVVKSLTDENGNSVESAPHPGQKLYPDLGIELMEYDILRRKNVAAEEKKKAAAEQS